MVQIIGYGDNTQRPMEVACLFHEKFLNLLCISKGTIKVDKKADANAIRDGTK